ncbi:hypothetical protein ACFWC5_20590 [Streptomyces sp. NPDC060085]|uniref:hypothetical protein n=1 Tax=Streptomyces sp. NPDC060085 TaxID=3347054 RepID=UPI003651674B
MTTLSQESSRYRSRNRTAIPQIDTDAALALLRDALGIEAITFRTDDDGNFVDLRTSQP